MKFSKGSGEKVAGMLQEFVQGDQRCKHHMEGAKVAAFASVVFWVKTPLHC